jgi:PTS system mannose-specific IIA component
MIGIVIATHSDLGQALVEAAVFILGERPEAVETVSIDLSENAADLRQKIARAVKAADHRKGVLILTDMFGGTPSNLCYSFLEEGRVEVLSGVNLPILIQALNSRGERNLATLAKEAEAYGKKSISLASAILKGNKRSTT